MRLLTQNVLNYPEVLESSRFFGMPAVFVISIDNDLITEKQLCPVKASPNCSRHRIKCSGYSGWTVSGIGQLKSWTTIWFMHNVPGGREKSPTALFFTIIWCILSCSALAGVSCISPAIIYLLAPNRWQKIFTRLYCSHLSWCALNKKGDLLCRSRLKSRRSTRLRGR